MTHSSVGAAFMTAAPPPTDNLTAAASPAPHRRVRWAMYTMIGLVALQAAWQAWYANRIEQVRQADAEIIELTGAQLMLGERVAHMAVGAGSGGLELESALWRSQSGALKLEALLRQQGALDPGAPLPLRHAIEAWLAQSERLWYRGELMLNRLDALDPALLDDAVRKLQGQARPVLAATQTLVGEVQAAAQARSEHVAAVVRGGLAATLGMLLALAWLVVEPTARAVRRQHERLAAQTLELERLAMVAERTANVVIVADASRRLVWANAAFERVSGYSVAEAIGRIPRELLHSERTDPAAAALMADAIAAHRPMRLEMLNRTKDGRDFWVDLDAQPVHGAGGAFKGYISVRTVITEQVQQRLQMAALLAALPTGVVLQDSSGRVVECNPAAQRVLHVSRAEMLGSSGTDPCWKALREDLSEVPAHEHPAMQTLASGQALNSQPLGVRTAAGELRWLLVNTQPVAGAAGEGVVSCFVDVTEQARLQDVLRQSARTDTLTQLPNRAVVLERVHNALARWRGGAGAPFAVLFMDFDRFKQVNDTLGHAAGDELLRQIAHRLQGALRSGDALARNGSHEHTAARIGGDEFVIVLEHIQGADAACSVAGRLLELLARPYRIANTTVHSSASIGIVSCEHAGADADADTVLRDADTAMYEAKRAGRGRFVLFDAAMHERVARQVGLENDLRAGLERGELFVEYQPVVDLETGRTTGVEALARWRHPLRGLVPPVEFIPVAEESGLIGALGDFVLAAACQQFVQWNDLFEGDSRPLLAVNLSRAQLRLPGLVDSVRATLQRSGLAAASLQLEVTESLAAQDEQVQATLRELKTLGVTLALDDFGTGYSSLACLHLLPVDTVKIDRSFVRHAETSEYHRVLIEATIRVAQTIGMVVVAEGVETPGQALLLHALRCDKGQGYLFGKPMDAASLAASLAGSRCALAAA